MTEHSEIDFQAVAFVKDPETGDVLAIEPGTDYAEAIHSFHAKECSHPATTPMRVKVAGGNIQVRNCCTNCGERVGTPLSQKKDPAWVEALPWQAEDLTASYTTRRNAEKQSILLDLARKQYAERGKFTKLYKSYLGSPEWQAKRALVLRRCGGKCEGCGTCAATEVHHVTYRHFGNEFLFELLGLCHDCHERITNEKLEADESDEAAT